MTLAILRIPGTNIRNLITALPLGISYYLVDAPEGLTPETRWIILPGVGHFARYMDHLSQHGWVTYFSSAAFKGNDVKLLGICSGFHALCQSSAEASMVSGLGFFDVAVVDCPQDNSSIPPVKSPHVGRKLVIGNDEAKNFPKLSHAFFTHSFTVESCGAKDEMQNMPIGDGMFVAAMKLGKIHGVQFHPELSGDEGCQFLKDLFLPSGA